MNDDSLMPFGEFKGRKMANVPPDRLLWMYENMKLYGELKEYIEDNLDVIKSEIKLKSKRNAAK